MVEFGHQVNVCAVSFRAWSLTVHFGLDQQRNVVLLVDVTYPVDVTGAFVLPLARVVERVQLDASLGFATAAATGRRRGRGRRSRRARVHVGHDQ